MSPVSDRRTKNHRYTATNTSTARLYDDIYKPPRIDSWETTREEIQFFVRFSTNSRGVEMLPLDPLLACSFGGDPWREERETDFETAYSDNFSRSTWFRDQGIGYTMRWCSYLRTLSAIANNTSLSFPLSGHALTSAQFVKITALLFRGRITDLSRVEKPSNAKIQVDLPTGVAFWVAPV